MSGPSRGRVLAVGLGPAGPDLISPRVADLLASGRPRFLRTRVHPAAEAVPAEVPSFDDLYERARSFEEVYRSIVEELVKAAGDAGEVVYALPGSPLVGERTVELLRGDPRVELHVVASTSFLDLAWGALGVDPLAASVRLVDAAGIALEIAGQRGPFLVGQCWSRALLSEVKLAVEEPPACGAVLLHHLGLPDEAVVAVPWADLDRSLAPDHLTSVWVPLLAEPVAPAVARLDELARVLRERCPWDRQQTHASLARHLREEAFEVLDALGGLGDAGEGGDALEEELGDLLYQVVIQSRLAAEEGLFDLADVARTVHDKLVRRHPHVFGGEHRADAGAVEAAWERDKRLEKGRTSALDGVPLALPALALSEQLQRRAASAGLAALESERALGDALFTLVDLARRSGLDAEAALRRCALARRDAWQAEEPQGQGGGS